MDNCGPSEELGDPNNYIVITDPVDFEQTAELLKNCQKKEISSRHMKNLLKNNYNELGSSHWNTFFSIYLVITKHPSSFLYTCS